MGTILLSSLELSYTEQNDFCSRVFQDVIYVFHYQRNACFRKTFLSRRQIICLSCNVVQGVKGLR